MHPGIVTRRAVLPILAGPAVALAAGVAAPAEDPPDPVFALIEAHRSAFDAFSRAVDLLEAAEKLPTDDHRLTVAQHLWDQTNDAEAAALDAVTSCRPTTLAGIVALARYVEAHERKCRGPSAEDGRPWQALGAIAGALAVMAPAAPAAAVGAGAMSPAMPQDADHEPKALLDRWQRKVTELDGADHPDPVADRLCGELRAIEREIRAYPATSIEALRVKAEVAKQHLNPFAGERSIEDVTLRSVFDAIDALAGRA